MSEELCDCLVSEHISICISTLMFAVNGHVNSCLNAYPHTFLSSYCNWILNPVSQREGKGMLEHWTGSPCVIYCDEGRLSTNSRFQGGSSLQLSSPCQSSRYGLPFAASITVKIMLLAPPACLCETPIRAINQKSNRSVHIQRRNSLTNKRLESVAPCWPQSLLLADF